MGTSDASRHMAHYLGNSGRGHGHCPVDKMMSDDSALPIAYVDKAITSNARPSWREQALAGVPPERGPARGVSRRNPEPPGLLLPAGGPSKNWYYAVGSTRTNVTGVVTVVPDANGQPQGQPGLPGQRTGTATTGTRTRA